MARKGRKPEGRAEKPPASGDEAGELGSPAGKHGGHRPPPQPPVGGRDTPVIGLLSVPVTAFGHRPPPLPPVGGGGETPTIGVLSVPVAALGHRPPPLPPVGGGGETPTIGVLSVRLTGFGPLPPPVPPEDPEGGAPTIGVQTAPVPLLAVHHPGPVHSPTGSHRRLAAERMGHKPRKVR